MSFGPGAETNWISKLKNIFSEQIDEGIDEDEISNYESQTGDNSLNSLHQLNEELGSAKNIHMFNLNSSLNLDEFENDAENKRNVYLKVANAFLEQSMTESEEGFLIDNNYKGKETRVQRKIMKSHYNEFETDFQLNKLNEDIIPALDVIEMTVFDRIQLFQALTIFEKAFKQIWYTKELISHVAFKIVNHSIFTAISLAVIGFNSVMLAQDDPTTNNDNNATIDLVLLIIYSIEMVLKILAYGFIFSKNAYLQDAWNIVDIVIIVTGYLPYFINSNSVNLSALRSLRVLRPLRSVSKVKSLNQLLTALFSAIPLLKDVLIILGFFFATFGIAGLQLFAGQLKTRCQEPSTGIILGDESANLFLCAIDSDCPIQDGINYICSKQMNNPGYGFINFDTFGWSVLNVYIIVSNEGWSQTMRLIQVGFSLFLTFKYVCNKDTFKIDDQHFQYINQQYYTLFYFLFTIYIGTFFLMNLTMAIIGVKYSESIKNQSSLGLKNDIQEGYDMKNLIRWGIYKSNKILYKELNEKSKQKRNLFDLSFNMGSFLTSFKNSNKLKPQNSTSFQKDIILETMTQRGSKLSKIYPLMGSQNTQGDELSPKLSLDQPIVLNGQFKSVDDQILNEIIKENNDEDEQDSENEEIQIKKKEEAKENDGSGLTKFQDSVQPISPKKDQKFSYKKQLTQKNIQSNPFKKQATIASHNPFKNSFLKSKTIRQKQTQPSNQQINTQNNLENNIESKQNNAEEDYKVSEIHIKSKKTIISNDKLELMDPSILANKLETINSEKKLQNQKSRRLTLKKEKCLDSKEIIKRDHTTNTLFVGDKKINLQPISNQKRKQAKQPSLIKKTIEEIEQGSTSERKRLYKNPLDIRRASKKFMNNFQFLDQGNEDEMFKLDDEEFLQQIEYKDKQKKELHPGYQQDKDIENQYLQKWQKNNKNTENNKNKQIRSLSPTISPTSKTQSNKKQQKSQKLDEINLQYNSKQNPTQLAADLIPIIQNKKKTNNGEKRQFYLGNQNTSQSQTSNQFNNKKRRSSQTVNENTLSFLYQKSQSDTSELSQEESPKTGYKQGFVYDFQQKKSSLSSLFNDFEMKFGQNSYTKSQQIQTPRDVILNNIITPKNPNQQNQEEKNDDDYETEEEDIFQNSEGNKIEGQINAKFYKQIDAKSEEFRLLLDSKYLKPRVLYSNVNEYSDQIQPKKQQRLEEEIRLGQQNKLKSMKFVIRQSTNTYISRTKSRSQKTQQTVPYRKSKRVQQIRDEQILNDIIEGKSVYHTYDNQSQKLSKQGDNSRKELSIIGSPKPYNFLTPIPKLLNNSKKNFQEDHKNIFILSPSQTSAQQSPSAFYKQSNQSKLEFLDSLKDQIKENESIKENNSQLPKNICFSETMQINNNEIIEQSIHQESESQSPSGLNKNIHEEKENNNLKDKVNSKNDIQQDQDINYFPARIKSIVEKDELPDTSLIKSNFSKEHTFQNNNDSINEIRSRETTKTEKKQIYGSSNTNQKKSRISKGDELEYQWNHQKAFNKIFSESQDNDANNNVPQAKNKQENLMNMIEQRILKKSERQMDILIRQQSTLTDSKSNLLLSKNLSLMDNMNDEQEKEQGGKKNQENEVEFIDLDQLSEQQIDYNYQQIRKKEIYNLEKRGNNTILAVTSADDILVQAMRTKSQHTLDQLINSLNYSVDITEQNEGGTYGIIQAFRRRVKYLVLHSVFDNMIMLCVIMNTVILCLDGLINNEQSITILSKFNYSFTIIFAIDMVLKIIGQGLLEYCSDKMNIFDAIIVNLSIFELIFLGGSGSSISAFRSIRILRVFRVLRMTRLLRSLQFMKLMITAIASTLEQFIYTLLLLFLFMFIYTLLGMSIFGGNFPAYSQSLPSRFNFDSFWNAAFAVLDVLTLENWNDLLTTCLIASNVNNYICSFYLISWVFIGNYVFMNLVLAIVMDSFDSVEVQRDKKDIENRFEILPDLDLKHQSMGMTFMNNISQISGMTGKSQQLSKSGQISKQFSQRSKFSQNQSLNESSLCEKPKSVHNIEDEEENSNYNVEQQYQRQSTQQFGANSSKKVKDKQIVYFEHVECEMSIYLFSKEGRFRRICYSIYKHQMFERVVLIVIVLTSVKLTVDTYITSDSGVVVDVSNAIDQFFTIFFIIEAVIKIIALGFIQDNGSYLRDSWSQLDFFIVCSSIIDMSLSSIDLSAIKILRLLRTLRPLRLLSQNKSMKLIVTALLESVGGIANMIIVVILIWLMFAILGMNLMKGKLNYCDFSATSINYDIYSYNEQQCAEIPNAEWKTYDVNSDNIGESMLMLFILSSFEGWPNYVWNYIDASDSGPMKNNSTYFAAFFFVFIFIGSFFSINLFTAIISFNFDIASKKSKNQFLSDEQSQWIELQRLIINSTPDFTSMKPPDNKFRKFLWRIVESSYLETIIIVCIMGNIISMSMTYDTSNKSYDEMLSNINLAFTIVFILESTCKIIAYGVQGFFYKGWNQFDFFVVCTSVVDITMTYSGQSVFSFLKIGPQIARVLRVLRVSRLLKLIKSFQGLQKLVQTTIFAFPKLLNATALFMLFYFIFANLACFLFSSITDGQRIDHFTNFSTFHRSFLMLFRCSTGEDWYIVMFDAVKHQGMFSIIFFISFYTVQSYILMNLFVLIIMNEFEENYINPDNPLQNFNEQEENFKSRWVLMTQKENGIKIHERFLADFYFELKKPLGFDYEQLKKEFIENLKLRDKEIKQSDINSKLERYRVRQKQEAEKKIMKMNIFCDYDGFVYFNELFFYFFKYSLYESVYEFDSANRSAESIQRHDKAITIMKKEEKVSTKKIEIIKRKQSSLLKSKIVSQRQQGVNPMVRRLFVGMAFRSWLQYSIKTQDNINQINFNKDDISSQSDTDNSMDISEEQELQDSEDKYFLLNNEDEIQFQRSKNKFIVRREHTAIYRKGALEKYRESHKKQQQINKSKKYHHLPDVDIYKNEFYDEKNNKYLDSHVFDQKDSQDNQYSSHQSLSHIQRATNQNITPNKLRDNLISNQIDENQNSEISSSSSVSETETYTNDKKNGSRQQDVQIPRLMLEKLEDAKL